MSSLIVGDCAIFLVPHHCRYTGLSDIHLNVPLFHFVSTQSTFTDKRNMPICMLGDSELLLLPLARVLLDCSYFFSFSLPLSPSFSVARCLFTMANQFAVFRWCCPLAAFTTRTTFSLLLQTSAGHLYSRQLICAPPVVRWPSQSC